MEEQFTKTYFNNGVVYQLVDNEVIEICPSAAHEICNIGKSTRDQYNAKFCVINMNNCFKYSAEAVTIIQTSVSFRSFYAIAIITTNYTMRLLSKIIFSESKCPNSFVFNSEDDAINWFKNFSPNK